MPGFVLEFEKPVEELEARIRAMQHYPLSENEEVAEEIEQLRQQANKLREKIYSKLSRWQRVQLARHPNRPFSLDYITRISRDFIELHGDRAFADDPALIAGFANMDQHVVMFLGQQKGRDTKEKLYRNFGMMHPEGYRKALRLMKLAAKFNRPIVCLIDTPGAYPGIGAEERGQAEAIARNLFEMARMPVPILIIIIGEGASGGALGIGVGDRVLMLENTWYSVISPEGCAAILWRDSARANEAAEAMKITAEDMLKLGLVDRIVKEPLGGAHRNYDEAAALVRRAILEELEELKKIPPDKLIEARIEKFGKMGDWQE